MQLVYVRNVRKARSASMIAFGLAAVAVAALTTGPPMPAQLIPLAGLSAAAMWWVAQRLAATPDPVSAASLPGEASATASAELILPARLRNDPTVARIVEVCQGTLREQVILDVDSVKFDGTHVVEFALKCVTAGALASTGLAMRVQNAVRKSVPAPPGAAVWKMIPNVKADVLKLGRVRDAV